MHEARDRLVLRLLYGFRVCINIFMYMYVCMYVRTYVCMCICTYHMRKKLCHNCYHMKVVYQSSGAADSLQAQVHEGLVLHYLDTSAAH